MLLLSRFQITELNVVVACDPRVPPYGILDHPLPFLLIFTIHVVFHVDLKGEGDRDRTSHLGTITTVTSIAVAGIVHTDTGHEAE